jgi:hypothetical protein
VIGSSLRRSTSCRRALLLLALPALLVLSATVSAAETQRLPLGQGALAAPAASWKASAVPPGSIVIDLLDASGATTQTYGKSFAPLAPRKLDAAGFRPQSLPSRHALLAGAAGSQVRKVKVHLKGGQTRVLKTVPAPPEWELSNRLFALGFTVPARYANVMNAVTKIEGLSATGKTIATLGKVSTAAY